jgi:hypothetical protein
MSASSATGPIMARPKVKLPCRFAHRIISGRMRHGGGASVSRARMSAAIHATMIGKASTCGRASTCGASSTSAHISATSTGVVCHSRIRKRASNAKARPVVRLASATTAGQPPVSKAIA